MKNKFDEDGYLRVENLLDEPTVKVISEYFENKIKRGEWSPKEFVGPEDSSKFGYYADPLIEVMLARCLPVIEQEIGIFLDPTYSYARVYQGGEELKPHTDRESCEITATVNVAFTGEPWPIWMQYKNNDPVKCVLTSGDAIVYKGREVTHWRRVLPEGEVNVQFMLHYVEKNGAFADFKLDKRRSLGMKASLGGG